MAKEEKPSHSVKTPPALTSLEKSVMALIQTDIPIVKQPFAEIAEQVGADEDAVLEALRRLHKEGIIRRFGATIRHQLSGYGANAMVAWQVEEDRVDDVGKMMAAFEGVSHCYRRNPVEGWPYNLYTMIHGKTEKECYQMAEAMSALASAKTYSLLFSREELKKTSMKYFP